MRTFQRLAQLAKKSREPYDKSKSDTNAAERSQTKIMRAYNIKLALRGFWSYQYRKSAESYLKRWYFWATHRRLDPVIECAKTIKHQISLLLFI